MPEIVTEDMICFVVANKGSAGVKNFVKRGLWSRLYQYELLFTSIPTVKHEMQKKILSAEDIITWHMKWNHT